MMRGSSRGGGAGEVASTMMVPQPTGSPMNTKDKAHHRGSTNEKEKKDR
jgi:hypothetical protein